MSEVRDEWAEKAARTLIRDVGDDPDSYTPEKFAIACETAEVALAAVVEAIQAAALREAADEFYGDERGERQVRAPAECRLVATQPRRRDRRDARR